MNALLALRPCKAFGRSFQASLPCLPLPLHRTSPSPQPLQKDNYPLPYTNTLASPRKRGGGLTARNKPKFYSVFYGIYPTFIITKSVCRQDGGDCECLEALKIVFLLISIPIPTINEIFRTIPLSFRRVRFCCSVKSSHLRWGL